MGDITIVFNKTYLRVLFCIIFILLGVYKVGNATADSISWTKIADNSTGTITIDPHKTTTLYIADMGLLKSTNSGGDWTKVHIAPSDPSISFVLFDPVQPTTMYAGGQGGLYKSTNDGINWVVTGITGLSDTNLALMAIDPVTPSTFYVETISGHLFKSTDAGKNWIEKYSSPSSEYITELRINPLSPAVLYLGTSDSGVLKSEDYGDTWISVNNGLTNPEIIALAIDPSTPTTLYAGTLGSGVFKSTDGGGSWKTSNGNLTNYFVNDLAIDPKTPSTLYAGTIAGGVFQSLDSGLNWTAVNSGLTALHLIKLVIDPITTSNIYAAAYGGIFSTKVPSLSPDILLIYPRQKSTIDTDFTLAVTGSGFLNNAEVMWGNISLATTFVDANHLNAFVPSTLLHEAEIVPLTVINPDVPGDVSNWIGFPIYNPHPGLTSLYPASIPANSPDFTITINGTNFVDGAYVYLKSTYLLTSYVSPTQLTAVVPGVLLNQVGSFNLWIDNPSVEGGSSPSLNFDVTYPMSLSTLVPSSKLTGSSGFTLTVMGTNFNQNTLVFWDGTPLSTTFANSTQLTADIPALLLVTGRLPGISVADPSPGGGFSNPLTFTVANPSPAVVSLSPASKTVYSPDFTLTVNGTGFVNGAVVKWGCCALTTTFVSASQLTAIVPGPLLNGSWSETVNISVSNPTPGGGISNSSNFMLTNPIPSTTSLSTNTIQVNSTGFDLTIHGSDFVVGSIVKWGTSVLNTSYFNSATLTAMVPTSALTSAGTFVITVENPTPGGGTSNGLDFLVKPSLIATSLSPTRKAVNSGGFTLMVYGTGFSNSSVVKWGDTSLTTTFLNSTQLYAAVPASALTVVENILITVAEMSPGGETSNELSFAIDNPTPTIMSTSPSHITVNNPGFTLTVYGTNFANNTVVYWGAVPIPTTFVNEYQLTAAVPAAALTNIGGISVTVLNNLVGSKTSNALEFTIANPAPHISRLNTTQIFRSSPDFTILIDGDYFVNGAVVKWNGILLATTYISSSQVSAVVPAQFLQITGKADVHIENPTPNEGESNRLVIDITNGVFLPLVIK